MAWLKHDQQQEDASTEGTKPKGVHLKCPADWNGNHTFVYDLSV